MADSMASGAYWLHSGYNVKHVSGTVHILPLPLSRTLDLSEGQSSPATPCGVCSSCCSCCSSLLASRLNARRAPHVCPASPYIFRSRGVVLTISIHFAECGSERLIGTKVVIVLPARKGRRHMRLPICCQGNGPLELKPACEMSPSTISHHCWHRVSMHIVVRLPKSERGSDAVSHDAVDQLSQIMHLMPTFATSNAPTGTKLYIDGVRKHHGTPADVIMSRQLHPIFTSSVRRSLSQGLGTKINHDHGLSRANRLRDA